MTPSSSSRRVGTTQRQPLLIGEDVPHSEVCSSRILLGTILWLRRNRRLRQVIVLHSSLFNVHSFYELSDHEVLLNQRLIVTVDREIKQRIFSALAHDSTAKRTADAHHRHSSLQVALRLMDERLLFRKLLRKDRKIDRYFRRRLQSHCLQLLHTSLLFAVTKRSALRIMDAWRARVLLRRWRLYHLRGSRGGMRSRSVIRSRKAKISLPIVTVLRRCLSQWAMHTTARSIMMQRRLSGDAGFVERLLHCSLAHWRLRSRAIEKSRRRQAMILRITEEPGGSKRLDVRIALLSMRLVRACFDKLRAYSCRPLLYKSRTPALRATRGEAHGMANVAVVSAANTLQAQKRSKISGSDACRKCWLHSTLRRWLNVSGRSYLWKEEGKERERRARMHHIQGSLFRALTLLTSATRRSGCARMARDSAVAAVYCRLNQTGRVLLRCLAGLCRLRSAKISADTHRRARVLAVVLLEWRAFIVVARARSAQTARAWTAMCRHYKAAVVTRVLISTRVRLESWAFLHMASMLRQQESAEIEVRARTEMTLRRRCVVDWTLLWVAGMHLRLRQRMRVIRSLKSVSSCSSRHVFEKVLRLSWSKVRRAMSLAALRMHRSLSSTASLFCVLQRRLLLRLALRVHHRFVSDESWRRQMATSTRLLPPTADSSHILRHGLNLVEDAQWQLSNAHVIAHSRTVAKRLLLNWAEAHRWRRSLRCIAGLHRARWILRFLRTLVQTRRQQDTRVRAIRQRLWLRRWRTMAPPRRLRLLCITEVSIRTSRTLLFTKAKILLRTWFRKSRKETNRKSRVELSLLLRRRRDLCLAIQLLMANALL
jgi:hypothetical protein